MKNKKGFTLVELLSTITLLAVILGIVSAAYVGISKYIRKSYYDTLEESILSAGGEYFAYSEERPAMFAEEKKVNLKFLIDNKYISEVLDQKGNSCDLINSTVSAYKDSYDKTNYYVCLICDKDDYETNSKECKNEISYSLGITATVSETNKIYPLDNSTWTNGYVKLNFRTLSEIETVKVKDTSGNEVGSCEISDSSGIGRCSINIDKSGEYECYGEASNGIKTKSEYVKILIDNEAPTFKVYENETLIETDKILKEISGSSVSITNYVKEIEDKNSGVKSIKYSFEKVGKRENKIVDNTLKEFSIVGEKEVGEYELIVEVEDYAGNITTRVIKYTMYRSIEKPTASKYCKTLTYNGTSQTLTNAAGTGYTFTNNKGTNAGNYQVVAVLDSGYGWSDGSDENVTFTCTISRKRSATTGSCRSLTYTGSSQTLASGGSYVTYTNNRATSVGSYTVTVNANSNYAFSDGSTRKFLYCSIESATRTYTVSFIAGNGVSSVSSSSRSCTTTGSYCTVIAPTIYTYSNYSSNGYSCTGSTYQSGSTIYVYGNSTCTATATYVAPTYYTISYNTCGGSPSSIASGSATYGSSYYITSTQPYKSGYEFSGWSTSSCSGYEEYNSGSYMTVYGNKTLYAIYRYCTTEYAYGGMAYGGPWTQQDAIDKYNFYKSWSGPNASTGYFTLSNKDGSFSAKRAYYRMKYQGYTLYRCFDHVADDFSGIYGCTAGGNVNSCTCPGYMTSCYRTSNGVSCDQMETGNLDTQLNVTYSVAFYYARKMTVCY